MGVALQHLVAVEERPRFGQVRGDELVVRVEDAVALVVGAAERRGKPVMGVPSPPADLWLTGNMFSESAVAGGAQSPAIRSSR
ncbi:hypothetical protein ACFQJD_03345 [Haloplanus sp. GCM10025708]|uniref:hypothetical protein n=1 Tax=Haloplanus sp. GCM10025708 TaxID=3252679 RepID=UPI003619D421